MKSLQIQSSYLWFLTLTYSIVIVTANWFDARLVNVFGLITDAGTIVFPLTFLVADLITEVYGYQYARRAIWLGLLYNFIFILYGQLITHLPSPNFPTHNALFDELIRINTRIILASAISYLCSEPLNSLILAKLKIKTQGRLMGLRFVSSTVIASAVDSIVFSMVAFYGTMSNDNLYLMITSMWSIKVGIEILGLPISLYLANKLKQIDRIDMYDKHTNFNLFSLNTEYPVADNAYLETHTNV